MEPSSSGSFDPKESGLYFDVSGFTASGVSDHWSSDENSEDDEFDDEDYEGMPVWVLDEEMSSESRKQAESDLHIPSHSSKSSKEPNRTSPKQSKKTEKSDGVKRTPARRTLPPVLKGMMGEANLSFARGDHDSARKMCLEIIREQPSAPEPFQTLAQIYEEKGMPDKSLQFAMIAAHLSPRDSEQWVHLAELCLQQSNIQQAISCYGKAAKYDVNNVNLHIHKAELQEKIGDKKGAMKTYWRMVEVIKPHFGELILKYSKMIARFYHGENDIVKAKEIMKIAFDKVPDNVTLEDVNLYVELLIALKEYFTALEIFTRHCDVVVEAEEDILAEDEENEKVSSSFRVITCTISHDIPLELRVQLVVLLIHVQAFHLLPQLLEPFQKEDIEQTGDLFIDVVEALMSENRHGDALQLLKRLIESKNFSLAAVWLNYADCLKICGNQEEAISAYLMVMQQAPKHIEARFKVSELLNELGRCDEAITVLTQDPKSETMDTGLLFERCQLLKDNPERRDEFLAVGRLLLSRHCVRIRERIELQLLTKLKVLNHKREALKRLQETSCDAAIEPDFIEGKCLPTYNEEWKLFKLLCETAYETKQYALLQRLVFSALGSVKFNSDAKIASEIPHQAILACFFNRDSTHGYNLVRDLVLNDSENTNAWNMLNLIIHYSEDLRHIKFIARQFTQKQTHVLSILRANTCLFSGNFKYALSEYMSAFRLEPNPLLALMISISLLQLSGLKSADNRNALITQCIAFLCQYKELRSPMLLQEVHYNTGRCFHQLGLLPSAIYHYKKALGCSSTLIRENSELLDLKREIAFNLALIYRTSGAVELARFYIEKYIVV